MHLTAPRIALTLVAIAAQAATAQVVVTGRDSQLSVSWIAGYAADIYGGGAADGDGNLMAIDGATLSGNDSAGDFYPPTGNLWSAAVTWELSHQYLIEGWPSALDAATKISASGSSSTSSSYSGIASVSVSATLPGNLLALSFINPVEQQFWFAGSVAQQGPLNRNNSSVLIVDAVGLPVAVGTGAYNGSWQRLLTLPAGQYTIEASAVSMSGQFESAWSRWNYSLEAIPAVPEPGTVMLLLAGLAAVGWRARRHSLPITG
jgi:hypothetical protein